MRQLLSIILLSLFAGCSFCQNYRRITICGYDGFVFRCFDIGRYDLFPITNGEDNGIIISIDDREEIKRLIAAIKKLKVCKSLEVDTRHVKYREKTGTTYTIDIDVLMDPVIKKMYLAPRKAKGFEVNQMDNQLCLILEYYSVIDYDLIWVSYYWLDRGDKRYELNDEVIGLLSKYTNIWDRKDQEGTSEN